MYYVLTQKMQGSKVKIGCRIRMQIKEQNKRQNKSHDSHSQL